MPNLTENEQKFQEYVKMAATICGMDGYVIAHISSEETPQGRIDHVTVKGMTNDSLSRDMQALVEIMAKSCDNATTQMGRVLVENGACESVTEN